jgi:hypothetical protein
MTIRDVHRGRVLAQSARTGATVDAIGSTLRHAVLTRLPLKGLLRRVNELRTAKKPYQGPFSSLRIRYEAATMRPE